MFITCWTDILTEKASHRTACRDPEKFSDVLLAKRDKGIVMKAIVIEGPHQMRLVEAAIPILKPDEVLIRSRAVGICGSDVELYKGTRPQGFYRYPLVPGHEWSGEVAAPGERVRGLSVGERVVVEGFLSCGTCRNCRSG